MAGSCEKDYSFFIGFSYFVNLVGEIRVLMYKSKFWSQSYIHVGLPYFYYLTKKIIRMKW